MPSLDTIFIHRLVTMCLVPSAGRDWCNAVKLVTHTCNSSYSRSEGTEDWENASKVSETLSQKLKF
jgi:hypothetical protein